MWEGRSGGVGRGGRAAGREHCMGPLASNGVTCILCRKTAAPSLLKKTNFLPRPPSKGKLIFFCGVFKERLLDAIEFCTPFLFCPCPPALSYRPKRMAVFCPIAFHCRLMQLLRALCNVPCVLRTRRSGTEPAPATFGTPRETSLSYLCPTGS